ncbi:MAG: VacB/RNase II family 3'-5' exoribonuclease [Clostridia bacterium]|nr:VacB/RNase II family 3'-5' exoribonuclease [Clostridia bacterium]
MAGNRSRKSIEKKLSRQQGKKNKAVNDVIEKRKRATGSRNELNALAEPDVAAVGTEVKGVFSYNMKGFGFVRPDPQYKVRDIFIPPHETAGAMTGDRVTVRVSWSDRSSGKCEGKIVKRNPACEFIVGTLKELKPQYYLIPDNSKYGVDVTVTKASVKESGAVPGDRVVVVPKGNRRYFSRLVEESYSKYWEFEEVFFSSTVEAKISRVLGDTLSKEAAYAAVLLENNIRTEFDQETVDYTEKASAEKISLAGRADLRDRLIFTIDGAGAKDLDDAISLEKTGHGYTLGVHIADVSHYVRRESPVEIEARKRGTSVYFIDRVVPMLPAVLSNGSCSLGEGEDKYALSCEMEFDEEGRRLGARIFRSVINSKVRGVYSEVNDIFEKKKESEFFNKYCCVYEELELMRDLYHIFAEQSKKRGVIELEDAELEIEVNEHGDPVGVSKRERGEGEKLIEQFMIQANIAVASILNSSSLPCIYRVHGSPADEKLHDFAVFANNIGLDIRGLPEDPAKDPRGMAFWYRNILSQADAAGIGDIVSSMALRSMMKAKYSPACLPHFGIGADTYCHFTSPIRRYPDLFVHSVLNELLGKTGGGKKTVAVIREGEPVNDVPQGIEYYLEASAERAELASDAELRAVAAERKITDIYVARFMSDKIGKKFDVKVTSVIKSGIFVQTEEGIEGFIPVLEFGYATVDEKAMTLKAGRKTYKLGTGMTAVLKEADVVQGKLTFAPKNS